MKGLRRLSIFLIASAIIARPTGFVTAQAGDQPYYVVQSGDTLASIAARFHVSTADLAQINQVPDPKHPPTGARLALPGFPGVHGELITQSMSFGDTLRTVSRRQQVSWEELLRLNPLANPDQVPVGYSLVMQKADTAVSLLGKAVMAAGESLLSLAIETGASSWYLAELNGLDTPQAALPEDLLFYAQPADGATPSLPWVDQIAFSPLPLTQGRTFEIAVTTSQPLILGGNWMGKDLNFFQNSDRTQVALSGVYALADPGTYPLQLTFQAAGGAVYRVQQVVEIQSGGYPTDPHLTVDPTTIDPKVTAPENELVARIIQPATPQKYWTGLFTCPGYNPKWITSWFGDRRFYNDDPKIYFHTGVDYNGGIGIPVKAAAAGVVVYTGLLTVRGNVTFIDHGWGIYTVYFHQSQIDVKAGDQVEPGQVIGLVGATGRVTGAHLHWELWVNGFQSNPLDWLDREFP